MTGAVVLAVAALAFSGCLSGLKADKDAPDLLATGPCRERVAGAEIPSVIVHVQHVYPSAATPPKDGANLEVNATFESRQYDQATTDGRGCVLFRWQGEGSYSFRAYYGDGLCRAFGEVTRESDSEQHLEVDLQIHHTPGEETLGCPQP